MPDSRPHGAAAPFPEPGSPGTDLSATVEGGWGATFPEGRVDPGVTTQGPMATTNIESVPPPDAPERPVTHPPGMITTALGTFTDGVKPVARASDLTSGTLIDGKYRLEAPIGKGGMGVVWRADHTHLHGGVAIKFLLDRFRAKPQVIDRFWQEAKVMGELGHPNIVRVHDIAPASAPILYITMELLTQGSLRDYLKRNGGSLPPDEACELMDGVLSALIAAHKRGIVHRDIKPDNLMLATVRSFETDMNELQLKILDFGASLLLDDQGDINTAVSLMGTPYYMSPEQASGTALDQRSDLYSTAVVLYELLSGKLPHTAGDVHSLVYAIATEDPKPIAEHIPKISRHFREFFDRALAREPDQRFQTAEDMRQALRGLSRRLVGKNRNTALYMAAGDTGPLEAVTAENIRPDSRPLRAFRDLLGRPRTAPSNPVVTSAKATRTLPEVARPRLASRLVGAGAFAVGPALMIQWLRFGNLGGASVLDTVFAWAACAGVAMLIVWYYTALRTPQ